MQMCETFRCKRGATHAVFFTRSGDEQMRFVCYGGAQVFTELDSRRTNPRYRVVPVGEMGAVNAG